jgi:hypothetical protein
LTWRDATKPAKSVSLPSSKSPTDEIIEDKSSNSVLFGLNKTEISDSQRMSHILPDKGSAAPPSGSVLAPGHYRLYPFRWTMQAMMTAAMISSGIMMVGFAPSASTIAKMYSCQEIFVQMQTLLFLVAFIPGNFLVIWYQNKFGLRPTVSALV